MNVNKEVLEALKDIEVPVCFLSLVNSQKKPDVYVTFFEVVTVENEFADNIPIMQETHIQVDIWAMLGENITTLKSNIIHNMKQAGWRLKNIGPDLLDKDKADTVSILHKPLEFKKESEVL